MINHDLAGYHIAVNSDVESLEAHFVPEEDPHINALGANGVGELGITGTAAAIANAAYHATGIRVRDLPLTLDPARGLAWHHRDELPLTRKEYGVLRYLIKHGHHPTLQTLIGRGYRLPDTGPAQAP